MTIYILLVIFGSCVEKPETVSFNKCMDREWGKLKAARAQAPERCNGEGHRGWIQFSCLRAGSHCLAVEVLEASFPHFLAHFQYLGEERQG